MKKYLYILAALTISPHFSLAQGVGVDLDAELDQVVAQQKQTTVAAPTAALPVATVNTSAGNIVPMNGQPVYIVNQGPAYSAPQAEVQKQPTTYIEDTPLTTSRSEQIRKARQDAEVETEQKIVEKLEISRMEDEKKRAQVLFGDKFNSLQNQQQVQEQAVAQPVVAQPVAQPQPIIIQQAAQPVVEDNTRDIVREEIKAALDSEKELPVAPVETKYFSGFIGSAEYPDVSNVRGNISLGATFGTKYDDVMAIEGTFTYGNYTVDPDTYYAVDVKQYSGAIAGKYLFFTGMFRPVLGGLLQYSYRNFTYDNKGYSTNVYSYSNTNQEATSHAFDVGVLTGADLEFNSRFSLGFDFRYMFNLGSRVSSNVNNWNGANSGTPIEKLQYYMMSVVGRVNF